MDKRKQISDSKLKPLQPTLRVKKRFLLFEIESDKKFTFTEISENIVSEILLLMGAIDFGKAGIWILRDKFDYEKQRGIIKVSTKFKDKLLGCLLLIQKIENVDIKIKIVNVSGSIKGCLDKK